MPRIILFIFFILFTWACSQQSTRPAAKAFHNINAKYNAIWQADRLYKELKNKSWEERIENYSLPLGIFPPIDSSFGQAHSNEIGNLIRKASLVIDRHQNSKFIDDAYLIIGKGRLMKGDIKNATETFKYINSIDHDEVTQASALIYLYQIYIDQKDFESALNVENFIKEVPLQTMQKTDFIVNKAYYHQVKNEIPLAVALLNEEIPRIKSKIQKARLHFVLGQLFQSQGKNSLAQENFNQVKNNKPTYELLLNAQIASKKLSGQVGDLEKMLKEPKNLDKQSEIYLALGQISYANKDFEKAREYWSKASKNNPNKGELFLKLGQLFVSPLKRYPEAALYFDSAATFLTSNHPEFISAQKLRKNWAYFNQLNNVIIEEDSLQILGKKSLEELSQMYQKYMQAKSKKLDSLQKKTEIKSTNLATYTRRPTSPEQQSFYFYNDMARIQGSQEFNFKWGNRVLEDFWNRKNKNATTGSELISASATVLKKPSNPDLNSAILEDSLKKWMANIPREPLQITNSNKKIEQSLFKLAKFTQLEMGLNEVAQAKLITLLDRFPSTEFEAESLYLLYLSNSSERKIYREKLAQRYPDSYFRQLILKLETGNLSQNKEEEAQKAYEKAYYLYVARQFDTCFSSCQNIQNTYPNSKLEDKIVFLMALCKGGMKDLGEYSMQLKKFIQIYPQSPLKAEADALLKALNQNIR
jgi:TolA-binding protein